MTAPGPSLVCPGCGSRDVDLRRGLYCGKCAAAVAEEAGGSDDCPGEAVFSDGRVPCTLPRNHPPPHLYGDTLLPFEDEEPTP